MHKSQNELNFRFGWLAVEARGLEAIRSVKFPLAFVLIAAGLLVMCVASGYAVYIHGNL